MKSQVWLHKLNKHFEIKDRLLDSIKDSEKSTFNDGKDLITYTDYYNTTPLERKSYFPIFHLNANDYYEVLVKNYCIKEFNIRNRCIFNY